MQLTEAIAIASRVAQFPVAPDRSERHQPRVKLGALWCECTSRGRSKKSGRVVGRLGQKNKQKWQKSDIHLAIQWVFTP
jgi:hypothetical protein